eukprot:scaffold507113_cov83-Attheya_sp.AAC.2
MQPRTTTSNSNITTDCSRHRYQKESVDNEDNSNPHNGNGVRHDIDTGTAVFFTCSGVSAHSHQKFL